MYRRQGIAPEPGPSNNEATTSTKVKVVTCLKRLHHTNQYELDSVSVAVPKPAPLPDPFPKYRADARAVVQEFEDFLKGRTPHDYNYAEIVTKALQSDSSSERQQKLACTGEPIGCLVHWLEDIWHVAIDGPEKLRLAYGKNRLKWQQDSIDVATTI
ncbi:uncharacterized protein EV420DRAFT_1477071 [Desarmillaria tabescens]|uniref:Uncharacterized protein n=1 Tax=Armillaria tabescens TaxID=1929756 RepID=A0AA39NB05_ARMTA|nr:uncharacterized protein EV420DRAFT_1477071 [Desarmillaria tabescens]KAK0462325.1 hypothetical protein EV420DRAFT_1477071 [Desarmillaria tabescens]